MEDKTQAELKQMCVDAGLPTYGAKSVLIERLNASAAAELAAPEPVAPSVQAVEPAIVMPAVLKGLTTVTALPENLPPVNHNAHVQDVLDECRSRFPGLVVAYNANDDEVFTFDGGRQGRVTTTARQQKRSILAVAETYYNMARSRSKMDFGEIA